MICHKCKDEVRTIYGVNNIYLRCSCGIVPHSNRLPREEAIEDLKAQVEAFKTDLGNHKTTSSILIYNAMRKALDLGVSMEAIDEIVDID